MNKETDIITLQMVIRDLHGCGSTHVATVPVHEVFRGQTVWRGEVEVFDLKGHPAAASPSLTATQWRSDKPLARGSVYSWQVTALRAGRELRAPLPPASEARFRVLEGTRASALMSTLARVPVSHLALSALYAEAGMDRESLGELELLQQENPGSPLLVRLRAQLLARRPPR